MVEKAVYLPNSLFALSIGPISELTLMFLSPQPMHTLSLVFAVGKGGRGSLTEWQFDIGVAAVKAHPVSLFVHTQALKYTPTPPRKGPLSRLACSPPATFAKPKITASTVPLRFYIYVR